jgi:hypothetical protein
MSSSPVSGIRISQFLVLNSTGSVIINKRASPYDLISSYMAFF